MAAEEERRDCEGNHGVDAARESLAATPDPEPLPRLCDEAEGPADLSAGDSPGATDAESDERSDTPSGCYLAFGPVSRAERESLLAALVRKAPAATVFLCENLGAQWARLDLGDVALSVPDPGTPPQADRVVSGRAEAPGWRRADEAQLRDWECTRTEDEETLRVEVLAEVGQETDDTLQVSVRRAGGQRFDCTQPFAIPDSTDSHDVQNRDTVSPPDYLNEFVEQVDSATAEEASSAAEGAEVSSGSAQVEDAPVNDGVTEDEKADAPDRETAEPIRVEQTIRFRRNTPEPTHFIQNPDGGETKRSNPNPVAENLRRIADEEQKKITAARESVPEVGIEVSAESGAHPQRIVRGRQGGKKDEDISMQVDITATLPLSRDDTSPVVTYDERAHNRMRYQVTLTLASSSNFWTGLAQDISGGGLFVATYNTLPLGTRIGVTFSLPDGKPKIHGVAEVRWLREYKEGLEVPPGMGVCFLDLSKKNRKRIDAFVKNRETIFFED